VTFFLLRREFYLFLPNRIRSRSTGLFPLARFLFAPIPTTISKQLLPYLRGRPFLIAQLQGSFTSFIFLSLGRTTRPQFDALQSTDRPLLRGFFGKHHMAFPVYRFALPAVCPQVMCCLVCMCRDHWGPPHVNVSCTPLGHSPFATLASKWRKIAISFLPRHPHCQPIVRSGPFSTSSCRLPSKNFSQRGLFSSPLFRFFLRCTGAPQHPPFFSCIRSSFIFLAYKPMLPVDPFLMRCQHPTSLFTPSRIGLLSPPLAITSITGVFPPAGPDQRLSASGFLRAFPSNVSPLAFFLECWSNSFLLPSALHRILPCTGEKLFHG